MRVMNHNWSATKQRLHPQSVAEISRHSFVRGHDSTMWDIVWVSPQGHRSVSVSRHFLLQAPQRRSVPVPCGNGSVQTNVAEGSGGSKGWLRSPCQIIAPPPVGPHPTTAVSGSLAQIKLWYYCTCLLAFEFAQTRL